MANFESFYWNFSSSTNSEMGHLFKKKNIQIFHKSWHNTFMYIVPERLIGLLLGQYFVVVFFGRLENVVLKLVSWEFTFPSVSISHTKFLRKSFIHNMPYFWKQHIFPKGGPVSSNLGATSELDLSDPQILFSNDFPKSQDIKFDFSLNGPWELQIWAELA